LKQVYIIRHGQKKHKISENNLLDIKFKFVNHIVVIFVSELETYGYKAEEIKEQLEQ